MSLDTTASRSAATRPLSCGLVFHRTSWNPGGRFGIPPEAKLPSSHTSSICLQSIGYLTATTEWYGGSRGAPFGEGTLSPLRRYLKPLPKRGRGGEGGGERGTEAPLRYLKGASKPSKVP